MARMRAGEPDALDPGHVVDCLEQAGKVAARIVGRVVVIHDLSEQLHFLVTMRRRLRDFGNDVGLRAHPLVAARVRHDAEAAELVAAFDDRHVRPNRIVPSHHAQRPRHIVVGIEVDGGRAASLGLVDEHRKAPDRLRADDDVGHAGRASQNHLAFLLRHAAGHRHDRIAARPGAHLAQLAEARVKLVLRTLAHAARVDHDEVGVRRVVGRLESRLLEQTGHPLGVVDVHLAAVGFDQVFARH